MSERRGDDDRGRYDRNDRGSYSSYGSRRPRSRSPPYRRGYDDYYARERYDDYYSSRYYDDYYSRGKLMYRHVFKTLLILASNVDIWCMCILLLVLVCA